MGKAAKSGDIPIIDIGPFLQDSKTGKLQVAQELDRACREYGFLIVEGQSVSNVLLTDMREVSREYFELPYWEKARLRMPADRYRGFLPIGSEDIAYSMDEQKNVPDWRECFVTGPYDHAYDEYHHGAAGARFFAPNLWPDRPVRMRPIWETYFAEMERLAADLMRIFAIALGMPEAWFQDKINEHITNLSVSYYPPQDTPPAENQLRCGPHSDYGSLTIVSSDTDVGGLQVLTSAGEWASVPCLPDTFVINLGDLMAEWTNDRWRSTMHRVINPPRDNADTSRLSFLFFHQPNHDAVIECLPTCTNSDDPPKYTRITSGEHVRRKVELSRAPDLEQAAGA